VTILRGPYTASEDVSCWVEARVAQHECLERQPWRITLKTVMFGIASVLSFL
jgi:hypothetical protein